MVYLITESQHEKLRLVAEQKAPDVFEAAVGRIVSRLPFIRGYRRVDRPELDMVSFLREVPMDGQQAVFEGHVFELGFGAKAVSELRFWYSEGTGLLNVIFRNHINFGRPSAINMDTDSPHRIQAYYDMTRWAGQQAKRIGGFSEAVDLSGNLDAQFADVVSQLSRRSFETEQMAEQLGLTFDIF